MEFCLPPIDLGDLMPLNDFPPMLDWDQMSLLDSVEATRPRQTDDLAQEIQHSIWGQDTADNQAAPDRSSGSSASLDSAQLSFEQSEPPATPAHSPDVEVTAVRAVSGSTDAGPGHADDKDDSGASVTSRQTPSEGSQPATPKEQPPAARGRRRSSSASTEAARAKNRIAATKCRRKKKVEERGLEERKQRLHLQRVVLQEAADGLTNEVLMLKHEILRHAACGFAPLDDYISQAAVRKNSA